MILIHDGSILLISTPDGKARLPRNGELQVPYDSTVFKTGKHLSAALRNREDADAPDARWIGLRAAWGLLNPEDYAEASKAAELAHWDKHSRFCPICGAETRREGEIMKVCTSCGEAYFPSINPAIIVLIRKGDKALLVHAKSFKGPFFGLVAGFVETGENLEQCVRREVMEETGLEITNIRYFGSQSWPYPAQLMIGFTADYVAGDIKFADGELSDGGFFSADSLPEIPTPPSIARILIEDWVKSTLKP